MKRVFLVTLVVLLPLQLKADAEANGIIAVVGNDVITFHDVNSDAQNVQSETDCRKLYQGDEFVAHLKEIHLKTLNRLIDSRLVVQECYRQGYFYNDAQAADLVTAEVKKDYGGDANKLHAALVSYGETDDEYRTVVVDEAMIAFMVRENVDKKLAIPTVSPPPTRDALITSWIASLRARTYVKLFVPSDK